ncbi:MAG: hypothetical protein CVV64_05495 [Candidatus Wallbacteria bacterium HGW-Wallbacteria-1]|uniref:Tetratricopeptide repeat protein n=1 Tax=Candidatus Wallbacteria bacterium HGW-Wallbacteria-1 TaxID=2013854 RepID=A0A2N1PSA5_9BACT|nr:MAG: hypothetical protein CVV64_05495 [Candidatus Wallbacteria bacterium HGW-Wallbacteria-1]
MKVRQYLLKTEKIHVEPTLYPYSAITGKGNSLSRFLAFLLIAGLCIATIPASPVFSQTAAELFEKGKMTFASGDAQGAISLFRRSIESDPLFVDAYKALFFTLEKLQKHDEIVKIGTEAVKRAVEMDISDRAYIYFRLAKSHLALEQFIEAQEAAKKARELDESRSDFKVLNDEIEQKKREKAKKLFAEATELFNSGSFTQVVDTLGEAMRLDPSDSSTRDLYRKAQDEIRAIKAKKEASKLKATILATMRGGDLDAALAHAQSAMESQPDNPDFPQLKNQIQEQISKKQKAVEEAKLREEEEKKLSNQLEYHRNLGLRQLNQENWEEAARSFEIVLKIAPNDMDIRKKLEIARRGQALKNDIQKGKELLSEGKCDAAATSFKSALIQVPNSKSICTLLAKCYEEQTRYDQAVDVYKNFIKDNPEATEFIEKIGDLQMEAEKAKDAVETYKSFLEINPGRIDLVIKVADALTAAGNLNDAESFMSNHLKKKPLNLNLLEKLAQIQEKAEHFKEAIKTYKTILTTQPEQETTVNAFYKMGCIFMATEKYNDAIERFREVDKRHPNYLDVPEKIKQLVWKKYLPMIKTILIIAGTILLWVLWGFTAPLWDNLSEGKKGKKIQNAKALLKKGNLKKGVDLYEDTIKKFRLNQSEQKDAYYQIAHSYLKSGNFDKALLYSDKLAELERKNIKAYAISAEAMLNMGLLEKAIMQCRYALDIDPSNDAIHKIFQQAYLNTGKAEELLLEYEELAHSYPNNMTLRNIILKLKNEHGG